MLPAGVGATKATQLWCVPRCSKRADDGRWTMLLEAFSVGLPPRASRRSEPGLQRHIAAPSINRWLGRALGVREAGPSLWRPLLGCRLWHDRYNGTTFKKPTDSLLHVRQSLSLAVFLNVVDYRLFLNPAILLSRISAYWGMPSARVHAAGISIKVLNGGLYGCSKTC